MTNELEHDKLEITIKLPCGIRDSEQKRKMLAEQLAASKYGIACIDAGAEVVYTNPSK